MSEISSDKISPHKRSTSEIIEKKPPLPRSLIRRQNSIDFNLNSSNNSILSIFAEKRKGLNKEKEQ